MSKSKRRKKARTQKKLKELTEFANKINENTPKSELWFYDKLKQEEIDIEFKYNQPFGLRYIPDLINKYYRIIIEIDGSWHDQEFQKVKDAIKDRFYRMSGYEVIRIKGFDEDSYKKGIESLRARMQTWGKEKYGFIVQYSSPKVIRRKKKQEI